MAQAQSAPNDAPAPRSAPASAPQRRDNAPAAQKKHAGKPKKKKRGRTVLYILLAVLLLLALGLGWLYWYVSTSFKPGAGGTLTQEIATPPELGQDKINVLVLGIDYDEDEREIAQGVVREENGNTDMILYVQFDKKAGTLTMLQIPRDSFVGWDLKTGGNGRINALYAHAPDTNNRVQYLAQALHDQLGLPVDNYVTVNMMALRELVDSFGGGQGIEVYVPVTMEYDGSRLEKGYHVLKGAELEFFLRQRKDGSATPRGDIDRLNNQRYFYSAIFKYMRTMSWQEMVKLMPLFRTYVNTDLSAIESAALGVALMGVKDENILMGRLPVYGTQVMANGADLVSGIAIQQTADLLNQYFRPSASPVSASDLHIVLPAAASKLGVVIDAEMSRVGAQGTVESAPEEPSGAASAPASGSQSAASGATAPSQQGKAAA